MFSKNLLVGLIALTVLELSDIRPLKKLGVDGRPQFSLEWLLGEWEEDSEESLSGVVTEAVTELVTEPVTVTRTTDGGTLEVTTLETREQTNKNHVCDCLYRVVKKLICNAIM